MVFMTMAMLAVDPTSDLFHMVFLVVLGVHLVPGDASALDNPSSGYDRCEGGCHEDLLGL